jgi:NADH dehydrogenase FAD-containing subunit
MEICRVFTLTAGCSCSPAHRDFESCMVRASILCWQKPRSGIPARELSSWAPGLKKIDEATDIRKRLLLAFEKAEALANGGDRQGVLTFAVVGGGPTGVEMAGAIAELARNTIVRDFRHIDPSLARVVLVEAGPRLLPTFPEKLSTSAEMQLRRLVLRF